MSEGLIFYRCDLCGGVVSEWDAQDGGCCPKCAGTKIRITKLSLWEKITQILKHPKLWKWVEMEQYQTDPSMYRGDDTDG